MNVKTLILNILFYEDATGYEIKKLSTDGVYSYFVDISYGSIYPMLSRLEVDGLVDVRMETQIGKPARKIYTITDEGRNALAIALLDPPSPDKFKSEFLMLAKTAELSSKQAIEKAIDDRIAHRQGELDMINSHLEACQNCDAPHLGSLWVCNYGKGIKEFDINYLKANRASLITLAGKSTPTDKNHNKKSKSKSKSIAAQ
ncbi:MAG: PadR family transcriptional regulator [Nitratireductor sp.]